MGQHPTVIGAMRETAAQDGRRRRRHAQHFRHQPPLVELEGELADLHGKEAALVFTSGYVSNQTGISTIAQLMPDCLILSDALNHNSMIEGVRQSGHEKASSATTTSSISRNCCARPAGAAEADRVRERLFDGRRRRADRGASAISPSATAP